MANRGRVIQTYGRHRQRVVKSSDFIWSSVNDKKNLFSSFSSSSDSSSCHDHSTQKPGTGKSCQTTNCRPRPVQGGVSSDSGSSTTNEGIFHSVGRKHRGILRDSGNILPKDTRKKPYCKNSDARIKPVGPKKRPVRRTVGKLTTVKQRGSCKNEALLKSEVSKEDSGGDFSISSSEMSQTELSRVPNFSDLDKYSLVIDEASPCLVNVSDAKSRSFKAMTSTPHTNKKVTPKINFHHNIHESNLSHIDPVQSPSMTNIQETNASRLDIISEDEVSCVSSMKHLHISELSYSPVPCIEQNLSTGTPAVTLANSLHTSRTIKECQIELSKLTDSVIRATMNNSTVSAHSSLGDVSNGGVDGGRKLQNETQTHPFLRTCRVEVTKLSNDFEKDRSYTTLDESLQNHLSVYGTLSDYNASASLFDVLSKNTDLASFNGSLMSPAREPCLFVKDGIERLTRVCDLTEVLESKSSISLDAIEEEGTVESSETESENSNNSDEQYVLHNSSADSINAGNMISPRLQLTNQGADRKVGYKFEPVSEQIHAMSVNEQDFLSECEESAYGTGSHCTSEGSLAEIATSGSSCIPSRTPHEVATRSAKLDQIIEELNETCKSFKDILTPKRCRISGRFFSPRSKILHQCHQRVPVSFSDCFLPQMMKTCVKIGEGVYGEVYKATKNRQSVAWKVIPIEGDQLVNDERQKTFEEMLPEIVISKELSALRDNDFNSTPNFVQVRGVSVVKGSYPDQLLRLWDIYDKKKHSENDRPDIFDQDQLFVVFEFEECGCDLEGFKFTDMFQAKSVLHQVTVSLAIAEASLLFEHRDLHWGNVLIKKTRNKKLHYVLDGEHITLDAHNVRVAIIDFTLSRLTKDGCHIYTDLSQDPTLFESYGDYQFDVYRLMQKQNGNNWQSFEPYTNVLWIHYLADKLTTQMSFSRHASAQLTKLKRQFLSFTPRILHYSSATDLLKNSDFF